MSARSSILVLLRSPLKTLVTFLLLAATTFAFVSRGMEYMTTEQTISEVEQSYTAVGTIGVTAQGYKDFRASRGNDEADASNFQIEYGDNYMDWMQYRGGISPEAVELVFSSDCVEWCELRHTAGGITSEDYHNATERPVDYQLFDHWLDNAIVIATCLSEPNSLSSQVFYRVEELLAGDEALYPVGITPKFYTTEVNGEQVATVETLVEPKYTFYLLVPKTGGQYDDIKSQLHEGHRYLMFLRPTYSSTFSNSVEIGGAIGAFFDYGFPCRIMDLTLLEQEKGSPVTYEDYAYVVESRIGQILKMNQYTQELVYTSDMSGLPRFHDGSLYMTEGRMITPQDNGYVCVINAEYAARNGIKVGDSIDFSVDPNTMVYGGEVSSRDVYMPVEPFCDADRTEYELQKEQRSYEVVGIWAAAPQDANAIEPDALVYALNTVFVPESTYPWPDEVEAHSVPQTISFRLKSAGDADRMQRELGPQLEQMGYRLIIDDMGYSAISQTFVTMRQSALIGFVAMAAALLLSLVLITYLFIIRRKGEYAIMRALGVPARRCSGSLVVGLLALSVVSVVAGCAAALATTRSIALKLATAMAEITGTSASVSYSPLMVAVFGAGVLVLVLVFAAVVLHRIGRKSPLALLQGGK